MTWLRKLGRRSEHRMAMLKNQVTSLVKYGAITTTVAKAKELRRVADWMVTWAKKGYVEPGQKCSGDELRYRRMARPWIKDDSAFHDLFQEIPLRFASRRGGYTRILKMGTRAGDAAEMARIEWVEWDSEADRKAFEKARKDRDTKEQAIHRQARSTLTATWNKAGLEPLQQVGKALHHAQRRRDIKDLGWRYRQLQSAHDAAKSRGVEARAHMPGPSPLVGQELPEEYKVIKVPFNRINKYGGRGLAARKEEKSK